MEFNSYEEILNYLSLRVVEERNISKRISELGFSFFGEEKKELRSRLKKIKKDFKYYNHFIESATSFAPDLLAAFLVEFLSKNTNSRFLVCKAEKSDYCGRTYTHSNYKFICSAIDVMKMQISGIDVDARMDFSTLQNQLMSRYIRMNEEISYSLMDCNGLCRNFENFPELLEVGKKLVDLKIAYPMMSDEERLAKVLGNTLSNCRLNWQVKSFNKKYPNGKKIGDMSISEIFSSKR